MGRKVKPIEPLVNNVEIINEPVPEIVPEPAPVPVEAPKKAKKAPKRKNPPAPVNELGQKLKKDGTVKLSCIQGTKNLSKVHQAIAVAKKQQKELEVESVSDYSESESSEEEDEYEIRDPLEIKKRAEPEIIIQEKIVEKEVVKEITPPAVLSRIEMLMKENQNLKQSFNVDQFYDRMNMLSARMKK